MRAAGIAEPELELSEDHPIRGRPTGVVPSRIFGGQLVAHGVLAGDATVRDGLALTSMHAYFPGDPGKPVDSAVSVLREGRSPATRQVTGTQDGRETIALMASFHIAEDGIAHRFPAPVPVDPT